MLDFTKGVPGIGDEKCWTEFRSDLRGGVEVFSEFLQRRILKRHKATDGTT
jgi:hypothetical protein